MLFPPMGEGIDEAGPVAEADGVGLWLGFLAVALGAQATRAGAEGSRAVLDAELSTAWADAWVAPWATACIAWLREGCEVGGAKIRVRVVAACEPNLGAELEKAAVQLPATEPLAKAPLLDDVPDTGVALP